MTRLSWLSVSVVVGFLLLAFGSLAKGDDTNCTLSATCDFGTLVGSMSKVDTDTPGPPFSPATFTLTTDVYLKGTTYSYLYQISSSSPTQLGGVGAGGTFPFQAAFNYSLNWGVVTDLSSLEVAGCGDTGGVGCLPPGYSFGFDGISVSEDEGFVLGSDALGTGVAYFAPTNGMTDVFAFYAQSQTAFGIGTFAFAFNETSGGSTLGEAYFDRSGALVPTAAPEPSSVMLVATAVVALCIPLSYSRRRGLTRIRLL